MGYLKPKKRKKALENRQKAWEQFMSTHRSIPPGSYKKPGSKKLVQ